MKIAIAENAGAIRETLRGSRKFEADELIELPGLDALRAALDDPNLRALIIDWAGPLNPGRSICRQVRRREPTAPYLYLIAILAEADGPERLEAYQAGADAVLVRPCSAAEVAARVQVARRIAHHEEALQARSIELEQIRTDLESANATLAEIASSDPLTGLRNRRFFYEALDAQFSLARRKGLLISLVMLDVDQFKAFNDKFGHLAGDEVLRKVGQLLKSAVRDHDIVARYGGEEFAILLPATEADDCGPLVDRLRLTIADHPWALRPITISLGVATLGSHESEPADLVDQADRALYISKARGRDRTTHARDLTSFALGQGQAHRILGPLISPHLSSS